MGETCSSEGEIVEIRFKAECHVAGQKQALVETSLSESSGMKGNRHDKKSVRTTEPSSGIRGEQGAEESGKVSFSCVLEFMDRRHKEAFIKVRGAGYGEKGLGRQTVRAEVVFSGAGSKGFAANRADGRADINEGIETGAA